MPSQPLRPYVGISCLLPQKHSWGLLPLSAFTHGTHGAVSLWSAFRSETNIYSFHTGTAWTKPEPFLTWTAGKCGLVPWANTRVCFVFKYLVSKTSRGTPQRQACADARREKSENVASLAVLSCVLSDLFADYILNPYLFGAYVSCTSLILNFAGL